MLQERGEFSNAICRGEAKCFARAIRLARMTHEEAKKLIAVSPAIDAALRAYVSANPVDGTIVAALDYRTHLWEELEQLLARQSRRKRCKTM